MQNKKIVIILLGFFSATSLANGVATVGDLSKIQAETILLKAKAKQEEARSELLSKTTGQTGMNETVLPVVKSILGSNKKLVATLLYPNNIQVEVSNGDILAGGYRVAKIYDDAKKIDLIKGKEKITIGFSNIAPVIKTPLPNIGGMSMPVPPPALISAPQ